MIKRLFFISLCMLSQQSLYAQTSLWPDVNKEMKPWTRWWWLGSAVDKPNLSRELKLMKEVDFGGVEVTPIYGAKGYEHRYIDYLSPKWMDMLTYTIDESERLGMGVDINLGTGWPFGGPHIQPKDAATRVFVDEHQLKKGDRLALPVLVSDEKQQYYTLQALRAFSSEGREISLDEYIGAKTGEQEWIAPEDVTVIALFSGRTRQKVKRAAPGGEGFTLDHLGRTAVQQYFSRFDDVFSGKDIGVRAFFNDSYEVYGANWTDEYLDHFEQLKGYRLQDQLWDFSGKSGNKNKTARLKSDYREVLNHLLTNNFLLPFKEFSHKHKALSKNQAHGSPGNLIDLYAASDIAEVEIFGPSKFDIPGIRLEEGARRNVDPDMMMFKFSTSATNLTGKRLTSSETFTWLSEHFKTSLSQAKPEVEQLFLTGVNHVFYHGTTYSPQDVPYPGWLFYASTNFTTNNSFWGHLSGLNNYITRVQSVLQSTKPDNEILVYWPIYDLWHNEEGIMQTFGMHNIEKWLFPSKFYKQVRSLHKAGYGFDYISEAFLEQATVGDKVIKTIAQSESPYRVISVPAATYFSEKTFGNLLRLAEEGATIIFQALPKYVSGFANYEQRQEKLEEMIGRLGFQENIPHQYTAYGKGKIYLTTDLHSALDTEGVYREALARRGLQHIRRTKGDKTYYYIVNHGNTTVDERLKLNAKGTHYTLLDPQTGRAFNLLADDGRVRFQLKPGYAWVVVVSGDSDTEVDYPYIDNPNLVVELNREWGVSFVSGGPKLPKQRTLNKLSSWTTWNDAAANKFAGTAAYETSFDLIKEAGKSYLLELGQVAESAKVLVNGQEAGIVWSYPFELNIEKHLKNGRNTIRIEVANLMANRVKDLDQRGVQWRNYHEINFVNIDYKPFDASDWELMDSGLMGPVRLFSY